MSGWYNRNIKECGFDSSNIHGWLQHYNQFTSQSTDGKTFDPILSAPAQAVYIYVKETSMH